MNLYFAARRRDVFDCNNKQPDRFDGRPFCVPSTWQGKPEYQYIWSVSEWSDSMMVCRCVVKALCIVCGTVPSVFN